MEQRNNGATERRTREVAAFFAAALLLLFFAFTFTVPSPTYGSAGGEEFASFPVFDTHIRKQEAVVTASSSAGIVVAGYTTEDGAPDYMTVKFDNSGNLLWRAKTGNTTDGRVKAVAIDSSHNVIVTGFAYNMSNFSYDIRTIKYNGTTGAVIWDKNFSRTATSSDNATAIALDSSDNVYVGGYTQGFYYDENSVIHSSDDDFLVIKYNGADGSVDAGFGNQGYTFYDLNNVTHSETQPTNGFVSYNHSANLADRIKSLVINDTAADANYRGIAATGESWGVSTNFDVLTVKFTMAGVLKWAHRPVPSAAELTGYALTGADQGYLVKMDSAGDVYAAGYVINSSNNKDIYTIKLNGDTGAVIWQKVIDKGYEEQPRDMLVNGSYLYLTDYIYSMTSGADYYTVKFDKGTGTLKWAATLNTSGSNDDGPVGMIYDSVNGNIYITGYTQTAANSYDILTVKYKDNPDDAQLMWTKTYNGVTGSATTCGNTSTQVTCKADQPVGLAFASDGNIFVAGWTDRTPALAVGKATGGTTTTLIDTTRAASWTTANQWKGHYLMMTSGLNAGQERKITAYDAGTQTLTVPSAFTGGNIVSGDTYFIYDKPGAADSHATAAGTTTSLTDSGKAWPAGTGLFWKDYTIMMVTGGGANPGTTKVISGSTATGLTWSPGYGSAVALNNQYFIYDAQDTDFFVIKYDAGTLNRPTNLNAAYVTSGGGNKIALTWKDNASNEQGFKIQRRVQGGTYTDGNARTYYQGPGVIAFDNSIAVNEQDIRYYYRVYACGTWDGGSVCGDLSQPTDEASALATSLYTPMPAWMYLYSSDGLGDEEATSISFGPDNNPVATGSSNYDTWNHYYTIKFDRALSTDKSNDTGVVTGATPTTITDNKRTTSATSIRTTWANNQWNGAYVVVNRNDVVNPSMTRQVSSNTADTLTVSSAFPAAVAAGDTYFLYVGGTVASGTATSLTDTSTPAKNWTSNQWVNYYLTLKKSTGYQRRKITGNGVNSLTVTDPFSEDPAAGDTYVIEPAIWKGGATYLTSTGGSQSKAVAVDVDSSNNVSVTGYASTSGTDNDIFTIKYSGAGENDTIGLSFGTLSPLWFDAEKFYITRDLNKHDYPVALAVNKFVNGTSEVAVTGYGLNCSGTSPRPAVTTFQGTAHGGADCASAIYNKDLYVIKYPNCSNPENMCPASWATVYNGTGNGDDVPAAVAFDEYGNIYITGYTQTAIVENYPAASVGSGTTTALSVAGTPWAVDEHKFRHILVLTGNNAGLRRKITSNTQNTLTFEAFPSEVEGVIDGHPTADTFRIVSDNYDFFTAKLDRYTGNTVWSRKLSDDYPSGTADPNNYMAYGDAVAKALALDPDGNVWVTGTVTNSSGATSICAVKYNGATGAMLNTGLKCNAANPLGNDEAVAIKVHEYDKSAFVLGTVLTGTNDHDLYLTKYDVDSGEVAGWPKALKRPDTDDYAVAMAISPGGEFSIAGNTIDQGVSKILAVKYYFDGTILGSNIFTRGTSDSATSVGVNYRGEAFVTGRSANKHGDNDYVVFRTSGTSSVLPSPAPFTATSIPGNANAHQIALSWDTSGMPVDSTLRYKIEKADAAVTPLVWSTPQDYTLQTNTWTDTGLAQNKKYCYRLTARAGTDPYMYSLPLGTCPTTTLDPPPLSGITALNGSSINISWNNVATNTAYKLERKLTTGSWPGTVISGELEQDYPSPYSDTGLQAGTSYDYRLYVKNIAGYSLPSTVPLTSVTSPVAPTILSVTRPAANSDTQLNVSWAHVSGNTGYTLLGSKNSDCSTTDSTTQVAQSGSGTVVGTATGLTPATMYYFKVKSKSNALDGGSAYSTCFATGVRTRLTPPAISSALGKAGTTNTITLVWTDPNTAPNNETGFTIQYKKCSNDGPTSAGGCNPAAWDDWNHSTNTTLSVGANVTSTDISGLAAGTTYKFSLHADYSAQPDAESVESVFFSGTANLPTPSNFRYIAVTDTYIDVSWNNITGETNYQVEIRKSTGPGTWTGWETAKTTVSTCNALAINTATVRVNAGCPVGGSTVGDITTNSTYELRLKAYNTLNSVYTSAITVQTTPAAPTMLGAVAKSANSIEFSWQTDPTHTGYIISRRSSACDGTTTGFTQIAAFPVNDPFTVNATTGTSVDANYWNQQGAAFWGGTSDWTPPISISDATNGSMSIDAVSPTGAIRISTTSKTTGIALSWNEAIMRQTRNATHMLPSGDFDMQLDFNLPNGQHASTVKTNTYLRLIILFGTGDWKDFVLLDRYVNASGNYYNAQIKVNTVPTTASSAISGYGGPGTPEKFRVTRNGDVFTTYYWDGAQWVTFLSKAVPEFNSQSPYSIELHQYAAQANGEAGDLTLTTDIDNFKISQYVADGSGAPLNKYTDTGLTQGTTYCYSVSFSSTTNPSYSTPGLIGRTTFPAKPVFETLVSGLTYAVPETSPTQIHLSWNNVTGETGYTVRKAGPYDPETAPDCSSDPAGGGIWSDAAGVGADVIGANATGLTPGQKYCFKIKSYNADGTQGYGNPMTIAVQLPTPTNIKLYGISGTHIMLSWDNYTANGGNYGYNIYNTTATDQQGNPVGWVLRTQKARQTTGSVVTLIDGTNPSDAGNPTSALSQGTRYYYAVCTMNKDGAQGLCGGGLGLTGVTTPNYPSYKTSPSVLSIPLSDTQIQVSWNVAAAATSYKVQFKEKAVQGNYNTSTSCSEGTAPWAGISEDAEAGTIKTYSSLSQGTRYCTQIKSIRTGDASWPRDDSESVYGTVKRITTKLVAPALSTSSVTTSSIGLSWTDNTAGAGNTGYIVQRRTPCGSGTWATSPGGDLDGRGVAYTSYSDSGLSLGTAYEYQLLIKNADYYIDANAAYDLSAPSAALCVTTTPSEPSRALSARAIAPTQIALTWQTSLGATKYTVERKQIAPTATGWSPLAGLTDRAVAYTTSYCGWYSYATPSCTAQIASYYATSDAGGLSTDAEYCYRVKAGNPQGGYSALYSNTACARTPSLGTPSITGVTALNSRQIQVTWSYSGPTPEVFEIESTTNPAGGKWSLAGTVDGTTYTYTDKTGIQPSTASLPVTYYYRVRASKTKTIDTTSDAYKIKSDSWTARGILQTAAGATTSYYSASAITADYTQNNGTYGFFNVSPDATINNKFRFNTKGLNSSTSTNYSGLDMNNPGLLTGDFDFKITYKILEPTPTSISVTGKSDYIVFVNMYFPGIGNSVLSARYVQNAAEGAAGQCLTYTGCYFTRAFFGNFNNNKRVGTTDNAWDTVGKLRIKRVGSMIYMYGGPTFDTLINSNIYSSEAPTWITIYQSVLPPAGTTVEMKADLTIEPISVTEKSFYSPEVLPCDTPAVHRSPASCAQTPVWNQADDNCQ